MTTFELQSMARILVMAFNVPCWVVCHCIFSPQTHGIVPVCKKHNGFSSMSWLKFSLLCGILWLTGHIAQNCPALFTHRTPFSRHRRNNPVHLTSDIYLHVKFHTKGSYPLSQLLPPFKWASPVPYSTPSGEHFFCRRANFFLPSLQRWTSYERPNPHPSFYNPHCPALILAPATCLSMRSSGTKCSRSSHFKPELPQLLCHYCCDNC